jgi:hypothetical protein
MQADPAAESFKAIVRAKTRGGLDLPVIDVTHPRFRVPDDPASLKAQRDAFIAWDHHRRHVPKWITQFMLGLAVKRSRLMRAMFQSDTGFLDSIGQKLKGSDGANVFRFAPEAASDLRVNEYTPLVSFDPEARKRACRIIMRTSESGH